MSNVAKLKKKALELEQKRQFDKAIAVYVELFDALDRNVDEQDIALFNRAGDLLMRQGNVADAMDYYERAVDHYADGGFFNNAIALCNKILRQSPGRTSIYYKLGKISAKKGFKGEAKQNFLEYADRMQKSGNLNEAFRALTEFADLCPDQDDIRQMLAEQLLRLDRKDEAIEQLQLLHERYDADGRHAEAAATRKRLKAIDPTIEPRTGGAKTQQSAGDLVFLDLDSPSPATEKKTPPLGRGLPMRGAPEPPRKSNSLPFISLDPSPPSVPAVPEPPPAQAAPREPVAAYEAPVVAEEPVAREEPIVEASIGTNEQAMEDLAIDLTSMTLERSPSIDETPSLEGLTRSTDFFNEADSPPPHALHGLEPTNFSEFENSDATSGSLLDIDPTSLVSEQEEPFGVVSDGLSPFVGPDDQFAPPMEPEARSHIPEEDSESTGGELEFIVPADNEPRAGASAQDILAELEPPIARESTNGGATGRGTKDLPFLDLGKTEKSNAKGKGKPRGRSAPPAEPLIPSLTIDEEFAERLEEEKGGADAKPSAAEWTPGTLQRDPDEDSDPATSAPRDSTTIAAQSVEMLEAAVEAEPDSWSLRRELAETMLETGDREGGLRELEAAMLGAERANDLDHAGDIAEEIARIDPGTIRHHQKRVEYAFRTNDKPRLIEAYIALAEALLRAEQTEKARAVYQRVLDLAPDDIRAQTALESFAQLEAASAARRAAARASGRQVPPTPMHSHGMVAGGPTPSSPDFVNLGDWLRETQAPKDTRMVVPEHVPTGDEEADFQDMLRKFKQGIAENVDEADHQAHYDLGVAFKEMGLLDEAVAEFQKALRSPANRVPTFEALGQCFMEKAQYPMAYTVLSRALNEKGMSDDQLVGVLYLLGRAAEAMSRRDEALTYYQRVFVVDITFRDIADRIADVERAGL